MENYLIIFTEVMEFSAQQGQV